MISTAENQGKLMKSRLTFQAIYISVSNKQEDMAMLQTEIFNLEAERQRRAQEKAV